MNETLNKELKILESLVQQMDFTRAEVYSQWLAQTYFFVRHSTRLLNLSSALTPFELQFFHLRANDHAKEERSHEKLLETDLKNLGLEVSEFPEHASTKSFYQSQYFCIEHQHPLSFLGYVLLLETLPLTAGKRLLPIIEGQFGKSASNFIRIHSQEDVGHIESLKAVIERLDQNVIVLIRQNLAQSAFGYGRILEEIIRKTSQKKVAA